MVKALRKIIGGNDSTVADLGGGLVEFGREHGHQGVDPLLEGFATGVEPCQLDSAAGGVAADAPVVTWNRFKAERLGCRRRLGPRSGAQLVDDFGAFEEIDSAFDGFACDIIAWQAFAKTY